MGSVLHGKTGSVVFAGGSGGTFLVTSFTVTTSVDMAEITDMEDTWKTYLSGFKDWTATVETHYDSAGLKIDTLGTSSQLTLDLEVGDATTAMEFVGTALCTGHTVSQDMNDATKATWTFQGTAALAES